MTGGNGKNGGLWFVLDVNDDRSLNFGSPSLPEYAEDPTQMGLDSKDQEYAENDLKIHIRLLTPFAKVGAGSYKMTSVKNVKGTDAFLGMEESERQCRQEKAEECKNRKIYEKCNCVLWELASMQVI